VNVRPFVVERAGDFLRWQSGEHFGVHVDGRRLAAGGGWRACLGNAGNVLKSACVGHDDDERLA